MKYTVIDWETSNYNYGSAFDPRNFPVALVVLAVDTAEKTRRLLKYHYFDKSVSNCTLPEIASLLKETHDKDDVSIVGHRLSFDLHWCNRLELKYGGCHYDTMFLPYLELYGTRGKLSLEVLSGAKDELGNLLVHKYKICPSIISPVIIVDYCAKDVLATEKLFLEQQRRLLWESFQTKSTLSKPLRLMCDLLPVLIECEENGFKVDITLLEKIYKEQLQVQADQITALKEVLKANFSIEEFNVNSHAQISELLYSRKLIKKYKNTWAYFSEHFNPFSKYNPKRAGSYDAETRYWEMLELCFEKIEGGLGLEPPMQAMGKASLSTDMDNLKELIRNNKDHPEIELLNQFYEISRQKTLVSTFIEGILGGGAKDKEPKYFIGKTGAYLHTSYNQTITATGRLSSSNPNLQNWPGEAKFPIRRCIVSRFEGGSIASSDASQIELRYAGWYYGDDQMRADYNAGVDIHGNFAALAYGEDFSDEDRSNSKTVIFRVLYKGGAYGILLDPKVPIYDLEEIKAIIEAIYGRYKQLAEGQEEDLRLVTERGGMFTTPTGRRYRFNVEHYGFKNKVANYPIQGGATGDFIPCAMIACSRRMKEEGAQSLMIGQVHDDIIFDVYPGEEETIKTIAKWALTDGGVEEFNRRFDLNFDFPLDSSWKIKEHW